MHRDRQTDPAVTDQRDAQFLFPHGLFIAPPWPQRQSEPQGSCGSSQAM
jgi:hypothetical protein